MDSVYYAFIKSSIPEMGLPLLKFHSTPFLSNPLQYWKVFRFYKEKKKFLSIMKAFE